MPKKPAPSIQDPENRFERDTRDVVKGISSTAILNGVLLKNVALSSSTSRVYHNLGRPAVGFIVVDATSEVNVWRDSGVTATSSFLPLVASATATVSLWVF